MTVKLATSTLAPRAGWRTVFDIGGGVALAAALTWPESARCLRGAPQARVEALLRRVLGRARAGLDRGVSVSFKLAEMPGSRASLRQLLAGGRRAPKYLLWAALFLNLLMMVLLRGAGLAMHVGVVLARCSRRAGWPARCWSAAPSTGLGRHWC